MVRDEKTGITYSCWPCASPRAVFLCVHGLGGFSGRWASAAEFFQQREIACYALDLRGFGETPGRKGDVASLSVYVRDILSLRDIIARQQSGAGIFLVGESMGALLCFLVAGRSPGRFAGLICLAPAFGNRLRFSAREVMGICLALIVHPTKQFRIPFTSRMCTRDADWQTAMDTDPREHRLATARLLYAILRAQQGAACLAGKVTMPVLFLNAGEQDALVDPGAAGRVFQKVTTRDKELIQYPEMYHALSVERGREKVFEDIRRWIHKRI